MSVHRTACPLDCPDTCTLDVTVDNGRLIAVDAAPAGEGNPLTDGWICQKVKFHPRRVYAPERVLTPLIRTGPKGAGEFRPASWDEALDLIASQMTTAIETVGPNGVVPYLYSSSAAVLASGGLTPMLFARMGAPDVTHTICAATAGAAKQQIFGEMLSADPLDLPHARLVVIWGANPTASNTHLLPLITKAKQNGATIVVIDPRQTGAAHRANMHVAVMPGTDVALAYAIARILDETGRVNRAFCDAHATGVDEFLAAAGEWTVERAAEVCGIEADQIRALAELIATTQPATLRMGWGLERNRNGGSCWLAPSALWVLAGHFGQLGSGVIYSTGGASPFDLSRLWTSSDPRPPQTKLSMNEVGPAVLGELRTWSTATNVLFIQGANPANTAVDQGTMLRALARDDLFTVVHDQVMTDTAEWADVVLPATTHFEADDVVGSYGSFTFQPMPAVIGRVGESRTNNEVASGLAKRLGYTDPAFTMTTAELVALATTDGRDNEPRRTRDAGGTVQFRDTFPSHVGGKACLHLPDGELPLPQYRALDSPFPLTLISPASSRMITSMFGEFNAPEAAIAMHPTDAEARGIADGAAVTVKNASGEISLVARIGGGMRPGVCMIPKGIWLRDFRDRRSVNLLVPRGSADLAGGACFNDARVDVVTVR